jgi:inhibitor of the pro-sigma K processing machinery
MISLDMIVYALVGLALLFLIIKLLKWPLKILINGILGIILLYIANIVGSYIGFVLPINAISALIAGFLGIPGIIFLVLFQFFI